MAILTISDLGFLLAKWLGVAWKAVKRGTRPCTNKIGEKFLSGKRSFKSWRHQNAVVPMNKDSVIEIDPVDKEKKNKMNMLPFPLALGTCLLWLLTSSLYFSLMEGWSYFRSFYFIFVSVATIGLGDVNASSTHNARTVPDFLFIVIGIALFSMCLNVVQYELDHMSASIAETIMDEYAKALKEGHGLGVPTEEDLAKAEAIKSKISIFPFPKTYASFRTGAPKTRKKKIDHLAERKREEIAARSAIRNLLHKKAGWLRFLVGHAFEDRLLSEYQKRAKMRLASTQTENDTRDVMLMVQPESLSKFTSTSNIDMYQTQIQKLTIDLAQREREAIQKHVKRITDSYGALLKEIIARRTSRNQNRSPSESDLTNNSKLSSGYGSNQEMIRTSSEVNLSVASSKNSEISWKTSIDSGNSIKASEPKKEKKEKKKKKKKSKKSKTNDGEKDGLLELEEIPANNDAHESETAELPKPEEAEAAPTVEPNVHEIQIPPEMSIINI